jgi:hypothetical protein
MNTVQMDEQPILIRQKSIWCFKYFMMVPRMMKSSVLRTNSDESSKILKMKEYKNNGKNIYRSGE